MIELLELINGESQATSFAFPIPPPLFFSSTCPAWVCYSITVGIDNLCFTWVLGSKDSSIRLIRQYLF